VSTSVRVVDLPRSEFRVHTITSLPHPDATNRTWVAHRSRDGYVVRRFMWTLLALLLVSFVAGWFGWWL